jgi:hypothetical protein
MPKSVDLCRHGARINDVRHIPTKAPRACHTYTAAPANRSPDYSQQEFLLFLVSPRPPWDRGACSISQQLVGNAVVKNNRRVGSPVTSNSPIRSAER